ncbi:MULTISPECIES: hypothetical protein [Hyphomonas]|jgi:hypothetical protein|uniref:DUF3899 domain-containing protein n=1 Tax=Hyphomonas adhaerens TaxID=81029 RepID=A0A3B9H352_9PROT|nr:MULTISPECIES: hypothetical protein [Hyphomonas]MBB41050.1 hypothetical protein [Hyphomonas sp.]HAE29132.1 hypothetical protein [Hyphomonas adhaerens]|tara:strand:+ start:315 stop:719 length:405 start_codon:yes stop_codon:yes gene_type:complete
MPDRQGSKPNFRRLRRIQVTALIVGAGVLVVSLWLMGQFRKPEVAPIVMAIAFASIAFSGLFYFGALLLEGSLQKYILSDDTVIKGDTVEMVTTTTESGDPEIDKWIGTYAFTRNLFGMSLVPVLILIGLYFLA